MDDPTMKDVALRGIASFFGGPVDLAAMAMRPFGYKIPEDRVIGGSEWMGKKLQDLGVVSSARAPLQEFLASLAIPNPAALTKGAAIGGAAILGTKRGGNVTPDIFGYRGTHTAPGPGGGAPLHDLTGGGEVYPADVYSPKAILYYGTGYPKADREAFGLASKVRGNPDAEVTMYRAVPKDASIKNINTGDWVSLSKEYAKMHGESALNGEYKILSKKVKAKELYTNADSIHEFGYWPEK